MAGFSEQMFCCRQAKYAGLEVVSRRKKNLSLFGFRTRAVIADPNELYCALRESDPVQWDLISACVGGDKLFRRH
jgi:hypothetical protein